jgi:hypothetical protein
MNRTVVEGMFMGRPLSADEFGEVEIPESITNLFELDSFGEDQWGSACPMQSGWSGYQGLGEW